MAGRAPCVCEALLTHLAAGVFVTACATGLISTIVSNPFDTIKSRVMGQPVRPDGTPALYRGVWDCLVQSVVKEGPLSLMKGFVPCFARIGPRGVIIFITMEYLKKVCD